MSEAIGKLYNGSPVYAFACPKCKTSYLTVVDREPEDWMACVKCLREETVLLNKELEDTLDERDDLLKWVEVFPNDTPESIKERLK